MAESSDGATVLIAALWGAAGFASFVVATAVRIKSAARGDGLLKEWWKGGAAFIATFSALIAAYLVLGNTIKFLF